MSYGPHVGDLAKGPKVAKGLVKIDDAIEAADKAKSAKQLKQIPKPGKGKGSVSPSKRDSKRVN